MFTSTPFPRDGEGGGGFGSVHISAVRQSLSRGGAGGRQSYATPLQQVFEETRSMLINEGPSIFEATLGRSRLTLAPEGVDDFIGAMASLHEKFVVAIECMSERSQMFEVISAWMQNIDEALLHQKTNETDLSETNYRKLQHILRLECETWNLISCLYFQRLDEAEEGNQTVPFNQAIRDKFRINEEPYVEAIIDSDNALKEMLYILSWLEVNFEKYGPPDLSEKFFIWENTLDAIRRDKLLSQPSSRTMVSQIDPDAPAREGKQLHPLDQKETAKVLKGAFYYIRCGRVDNAITYLVKSGERIKAAALSGYQYTSKKQPDPETGEEQGAQKHAVLPSMEYLPKSKRQARPNPDYEIDGNPKRDLWKVITWKVCEKNAMSKYDRALLGSVCGHRQALLDVANNWEDRLWAFLKASTNVIIEERLRKLSKPNNRMDLSESYWSQKLSVSECISKVEAFGKDDETNPQEAVFQSLQKHVMMNRIEDFINEVSALMSNLLDAYDHPLLNGHLARFFTHLFLFLEIVELPCSQELIDICVERYIAVLVEINLITKTPFYIQKLSNDKQIPAIVQHINPDNRLTRDAILEFLTGAHSNELDVLKIGVAVVDKMKLEEDDFSVENLDWISCCYGISNHPSDVMYEFLKYTIWISRKYLTLGNIEKVQKLISQVSPENVAEVAQISESYENTIVREYICYKVYLDAEDALSVWKKAMGQRPISDLGELPIAATKADRTIYEKRKREHEVLETKWRRAVEFHLNSAIEKFLGILKFPMGWLRDCYNPTDDDEAIHVGAVRRIVIRNVIHILLRLVQDKNDNRTVRDFVSVLCDDTRNILCELSPAEIGNIFKIIEQFTRQKVSNIMFLPK